MKIEITGTGSEEAALSLLAIDGIKGSYEILDERLKVEVGSVVLITCSVTVGVNAMLSIAERICNWYQNYKKGNAGQPIGDGLIISETEGRWRLDNASPEQIKALLEGEALLGDSKD